MIIFDEKAVAERLLNGKFVGDATSQRNLNILGRYFKWQGMSTPDIQKNLIEYCQNFDPIFNEIVMSNKIEYAVESSISSPIRLSKPIQIGMGEMATIRTLYDIRLQKLLFTILAVSKYFHKQDGGFYFNGNDTDLFRLARLGNMRKQERIDAIFYLNKNNYIQTNMLGAYRVMISEGFDFPPSDVQVVIENVEKVVDYFPWQCPKCGKDVLGKPKRRKICDDCYILKRKSDVQKNVKKLRENQ